MQKTCNKYSIDILYVIGQGGVFILRHTTHRFYTILSCIGFINNNYDYENNSNIRFNDTLNKEILLFLYKSFKLRSSLMMMTY